MSSYDWLELENLTTDIDLLRDQLIEARSRKAIARVRTLEEEIARSEQRRAGLLAHLTINMISDADIRTHTRPRRSALPVENRGPELAGDEDEAAAVGYPAEQASQPEAFRAGDDPDRPQAEVNEPSETPGSTSAPGSDGHEADIPVAKQLAADESSPELAASEALATEISVSRIRLAVAKQRKDLDLVERLEQEIASGEARRRQLLAMAALEAAARVQAEDHGDAAGDPASDDQARRSTELPPQPDHSVGDGGDTVSSSEVSTQSEGEDASSHLEDPDADDDGDGASASAQEPPSDPNETEPFPLNAEEDVVTSDGDASPPYRGNRDPPEAEVAEAADEQQFSKPEAPAAASGTSASTIDPKIDNTEGATAMWDHNELELAKKELESRRDEMLDRHTKELKEMLAAQAAELRRLEDDRDELEALEKAIGAALRKFKAPSVDTQVTRLDDERTSRQGLS